MRYIDVTLDKPRKLRYDVNALDELERALGGMPLGDIVGQLRAVSVRVLRLVVWAGLRHEDKALTPDRVGNLIQTYFDNGGDYLALSQAASDAIEASGVVKKDEEAAPLAEDPPAAVSRTSRAPTASRTGSGT